MTDDRSWRCLNDEYLDELADRAAELVDRDHLLGIERDEQRRSMVKETGP